MEDVLFQSLFWWILLLNSFRLFQQEIVDAFQSLFWWILLLNSISTSIDGDRIRMFQSLFWWILLLNLSPNKPKSLTKTVSILVLVDFALKHAVWIAAGGCENLFQSLFWWILLLNMQSGLLLVVAKTCFNPCFGGFCS